MSRRHQRGFNLIEVLVALLVLCLGLLGIAGMQLSGIRGAHGSYLRSQAAAVMNDMAERIYVNVPGAQAGQYGGFNSTAVNCANVPANICARESNAGAAPAACTSAQMAVYDRFVLSCGLPNGAAGRNGGVADVLPGGSIQVDCIDAAGAVLNPCTLGSRIRITVGWSEQHGTVANVATGTTGTLNQSINMVIQP